jgi:endonuclease YncB( thermonuclease family)
MGAAAVTLAVLLAGSATLADGAGEAIKGPVAAAVLDVVDGDTLRVRARIWLGQEVTTLVRLDGVDTPELKASCDAERRLAAQARDFVRARIGGAAVVLTEIRFGKYAGRVVARVASADDKDLAGALIGAGLGQAYAGGTRRSWCASGSREAPSAATGNAN